MQSQCKCKFFNFISPLLSLLPHTCGCDEFGVNTDRNSLKDLVPAWEAESTSTPGRGTASPALPWMGSQRPCVMWLPCILAWGFRGRHHHAQVSPHPVWTATVIRGDPCCVLGSPWHSRLHSQPGFGLLRRDFIIVITVGSTWLFLVNSCNVSNWFMILGRKK